MSDFGEMVESWKELGYDPDYPIDGGRNRDDDNRPVEPDSWAGDDKYDGG